ncbi:hypothetical protein H6P81_015894 [Aristolochia fimbriata]|uniref:Uncharacterized protein n=1 Tax=Aristolochia fimbriata TaxID=158543 RepID=A0AAV7E7G0_ARIFI|nr:hypothetical protein H6P81_015894 [Aristolochia fimbriata]
MLDNFSRNGEGERVMAQVKIELDLLTPDVESLSVATDDEYPLVLAFKIENKPCVCLRCRRWGHLTEDFHGMLKKYAKSNDPASPRHAKLELQSWYMIPGHRSNPKYPLLQPGGNPTFSPSTSHSTESMSPFTRPYSTGSRWHAAAP